MKTNFLKTNILKKLLTPLITVTVLFAALVQAQTPQMAPQAEKTKQVLMVISGHAQQQENTNQGFEFDEFAKAYLLFKENNVAVQVASPQGGKVAASRFDKSKSFNAEVLADKHAMQLLNNSLAFKQVNPQQLDAIFVVGGNGAMFDLPENEQLQNIIRQVYEHQGVVAAVCHGPAALMNVKLSSGDYLVANRKVNAFTNQEENTLNKKASATYPFLLESKFAQRNSHFQSSPLLMPHSVIDGRLVTGQNQHSTGITAANTLRAMGVTNIKQPNFKDEASMKLISRVLASDNQALTEFHQNSENYVPKLIAMYANVYARTAADEQALQLAVSLMEATLPYFQHPKLSLALAKNLLKLGRTTRAKAVVNDLLTEQPQLTEAQVLLNKINNLS